MTLLQKEEKSLPTQMDFYIPLHGLPHYSLGEI